jgi:glutaredoxin|tara:strand:+ start:603 stop:836 length:234 start_codon:yes stop_codon:yes gene_type:complete
MEIIIYGKDQCAYCDMAQRLCTSKGLEFEYKKLGRDFDALEMAEVFPKARSFPQIIFDGVKIGGYTELEAKIKYGLK